MKKEFTILRERPKLQLRVTRDSVCAADDVDAAHEHTRECYSFIDPVALASELAYGYLPTIAGSGHSWDCYVNDQRVARIDIRGASPTTAEVHYRDSNHIHF